MSVIQEFREFAMRGNVVDLAVGVIMGASFAPIVSSLVDNIIMPPIGYLMAGVDFSTLAVTLPTPTGDGVGIRYGVFLNAVIKFIITAFAIFLLVKAMNRMKKPAPAAAVPPPTPTEIYLKEISGRAGGEDVTEPELHKSLMMISPGAVTLRGFLHEQLPPPSTQKREQCG